MGPPLFSDGDALFRGKFANFKELQWGRRFSATETRMVGSKKVHVSHASMGPPLFSDGDLAEVPVVDGMTCTASMGPPLFSDGDSQ